MEKRFDDIETIFSNYNYWNKSIGDWSRIKEVIRKYTSLSNGRALLENEIKEYIQEKTTKAKELEYTAKKMKEFLDDFLKLTDEDLKKDLDNNK